MPARTVAGDEELLAGRQVAGRLPGVAALPGPGGARVHQVVARAHKLLGRQLLQAATVSSAGRVGGGGGGSRLKQQCPPSRWLRLVQQSRAVAELRQRAGGRSSAGRALAAGGPRGAPGSTERPPGALTPSSWKLGFDLTGSTASEAAL